MISDLNGSLWSRQFQFNNFFTNFQTILYYLSSDLYRQTALKTVNTRFKFFAISISWAKTSLFSLQILHLFTPSSLMAKVFQPSNIFLDLRTVKEPSSETLLRPVELVLTLNCFSFANSYYKSNQWCGHGHKNGTQLRQSFRMLHLARIFQSIQWP